MILKGAQRAGAGQLAAHLLNERDNEHVRVHELRGFAADDLHGALTEAQAVSRGTKSKQFMFSLSVNPPKRGLTDEASFVRAIDEAERRLGLVGQPRAIVFHEKEGRRHAHVVWSRIDAEAMRAINLPHFKRKLTDLSRELYLEHGWTLPDGLRTNGGKSPLNFTLAEWQQAKRAGLDPRETKDAVRDAWSRSDSVAALKAALEERGYFLAQGDRRGFVVLDSNGGVHALARCIGVKIKEVCEKLGEPDALPTVADAKSNLARRTTEQLKAFRDALRDRQSGELVAVRERIETLTATHRAERAELHTRQAGRWAAESRERAARLRMGLAGLWDRLTGHARAMRAQNEAESVAGLHRDRIERDQLVAAHLDKRQPLQIELDRVRQRHAQERRLLAREAVQHLRNVARREAKERDAPSPDDRPPSPPRGRRGLSLDI